MRNVNIQGLFLSLNEPAAIWSALKGTEVAYEWKIRCRRIEIQEGKRIEIKIPDKEIFIDTAGVYFCIDRLNKKSSHPFTLLVNNGTVNFKDIARTMTYGKIKGEVDLKKLYVTMSRVDIKEDDGYLEWIGDLTYKDPFVISGNYSGSVKSATLAYFWKCFRQMEGQVISRGRLTIHEGERKVEGNLQSPSFRWWRFLFRRVHGEFSYMSKGKNLIFKNLRGLYNQAKTEVSAQVNLAHHKANVDIHTEDINITYFNNSIAYPKAIKDRLWKGDLILNLNWPNKSLTTEGKIQLEEVCSEENNSEPIRLQGSFAQANKNIYFKPLNILQGRDYVNCMGNYNFFEKQADLTFKLSWADIYPFIKKAHGRATISGYMQGVWPHFHLSGKASVDDLIWSDYSVDHVQVDYDFDEKKLLSLRDIILRKNRINIKGQGDLIFQESQRILPEVVSGGSINWSGKNIPAQEIIEQLHVSDYLGMRGHLDSWGRVNILEDGNILLSGSINSKNFSFLGQHAKDMRASFTFNKNNKEITLKEIKLSQSADHIINAKVRVKIGDLTVFDVSCPGWQIESIMLSSGRRIPLSADLVSFTLNGTLDDCYGHVRAEDLLWQRNKIPDFQTDFNIAQKQLKAYIWNQWGEFDTLLDLTSDYAYTLKGQIEGFQISDWIGNKGILHGADIKLSGSGSAHGSIKTWKQSNAQFSVRKLFLKTTHASYWNEELFFLSYQDKTLLLPSLFLKGEEADLLITGELSKDKGLDIRASGLVKLEFLKRYVSELENITGFSLIDFAIKGDVRGPGMNGDVIISQAGFQLPFINDRFEEVRGQLKVINKNIVVDQLTGKLRNGGDISVNGNIQLAQDHFKSAQLRLRLHNLFLFDLNQYKIYFGGDLFWHADLNSSGVSGTLRIDEGRYYTHKDIVAILLTKHRDVALEKNNWIEKITKSDYHKIFSALDLAIEFDIGQDFRVISPYCEAKLTGSLNIKGTALEPSVTGSIKALEGDIYIGGHKFSLASGKIIFPAHSQTKPTVNALALKDINEYRIRLSILGPIDSPKFQFSASPYLSQSEIVNMLFFGFVIGEGPTTYRERHDIVSKIGETTGLLIDNVLGREISHYNGFDILKWNIFSQNLFRLDIFNLKLQEEGGAVEKVTLGKQLSPNLTIKYSENIGDDEYKITEAEYTITDHLTIINSQDDEGVYTFDLNFGFDF
ncbi:MAG: translocation/assembly module TamB domain-containing protein [bacterium]